MFNIEKERIYKHTFLDEKDALALVPLMESSFKEELSGYSQHPQGAKIVAERKKFISEQYANRCRIAKKMGVNPLNEDSLIFGSVAPELTKLFESAGNGGNYSGPGNMIGMGNVSNPMSSNQVAGGMWNSAYKAGSGDIPSYVFGLQTHLAMHCTGFDLLPIIAVDTPKIVISFVDTVYGGGTFDDVNAKPSYMEISNSLFTYTWTKSKSLKRATSTFTLVSSDGKAMKVLYIVRSTVKAAITVEVLSTGTYATDTYTETNTISVKQVVDAINAKTGSKVYINAETTGEAIENVGIDYASAIRTNISEASSNNNSLGGMTRSQQEKGPKHKLNVIAMDKQLEMLGIEIEADTSNIQIKDMAAMGINVIAHLYTGVQNQLVQTLDEVILNHLYRMGVQHAVGTWQSQGIDMSLYIAAPATTTIAYTDAVGEDDYKDMMGNDVRALMGTITNTIKSSAYENQMTHADRLYARILKVAEFVAQDNRIGSPDFIVLPGEIASCLKKNAGFSACPHVQTISSNPELVYSGTIFETISVYKNPRYAFNDPRILMGRRGDDTDPGSKFLAYDLAASRQIIAEGTMAEKIRVWSRFAIADVGFLPELNYFTFLAINENEWA